MTCKQRCPKILDASLIITREKQQKQHQKRNFNSRHRAKHSPLLSVGTKEYLPDCQETGHVVSQTACQSYTVSTPSGNFRQNHRNLNLLSEPCNLVSNNHHFRTYDRTNNLTVASASNPTTSCPIAKQSKSTATTTTNYNTKWTCDSTPRQAMYRGKENRNY